MSGAAPNAGDIHDISVERCRRFYSEMAAHDVAADDDIFQLGLVNSLRALEIVTHVEQIYAVEITVEDLDLDNFRSAARLARFLRAKTGGATGDEAAR
ncbi:phosphopantetheine-binding protein [Nocardia blacklockiae]|uniref:phosphopantetheine-binding protein n=1 Tax=Nocardia blacklockiae TaxID=480036 RepID=UPI00189605AD|nr:phosphopantetheine-binding protein [Nocardia blacklockiae]MBF6175777.1 acyl carrier protein [Nocardia blacklockiae]